MTEVCSISSSIITNTELMNEIDYYNIKNNRNNGKIIKLEDINVYISQNFYNTSRIKDKINHGCIIITDNIKNIYYDSYHILADFLDDALDSCVAVTHIPYHDNIEDMNMEKYIIPKITSLIDYFETNGINKIALIGSGW